MTFLVENGTGVQGANAQIPIEYVTAYLLERNRSTEGSWNTLNDAARRACVIAATDYVEKRFGGRLRGTKKYSFEEAPAVATITFTGVPSGSDTITIAGIVVDVSALGGTVDECAEALADLLLDETELPGIDYAVRATSHDGAVVTITAAAYGELGNLVSIADGTSGDVTIAAFSGGLDAGPQLVPFPRVGITDRNGATIDGVPRGARDAICEYAVRAAVAALMVDPTVSATGRIVREQSSKVGPIEEKFVFEDGAGLSQLVRPYPAADFLLSPFLNPAGGADRW